MDSDSQPVTSRSTPSVDLESENGSIHQFDQPDARCIFCRRAFLLETETSEGFEAIFICRDCKLVVLDDLDTDTITRESSRRRPQRSARSVSSESIEDMFSQQFTELIGLVRHNLETQQRTGYDSSRNRSRRWRRPPLSDHGSENLEQVDLLFGENDSTISFSNGGESDASVDGHSFLDRDIFIRQDDESRISSDTDIDPMHAGQDQWNSDNQDNDDDDDDDDGEWEEADVNEEANGQDRQMLYASNSPTGSSGRDTRNDGWLFWRTRDHGSMQYPNHFNDMEEPELPQYFGNSGDYLDARGFEALLEQLAETESSRRGAPPAAASFVRSLPRVIVSKVHEKNGSLICAVCKDPLLVGTETNRLPCLHFYHPSCILPWLHTRNSCPVCRYELPTDDPDYEAGKRVMGSSRELYEVQEQNIVEESSSPLSTGTEIGENPRFNRGREGQGDTIDAEAGEDNSNRQRRGGWMYLTPIVSIVGMVLVLWLGTPIAEGRSHHSFQGHDSHELAGSNSAQVDQDNRNRRWWFFF